MTRTSSTARQGKSSAKQLGYLRRLAEKTGTSFTYPHTPAEASREIERLRELKAERRSDIRRERRQVADDIATGRGDSAQVQGHELTGYGSSATWAHTQEREPTEKQIGYLRHLSTEAGENFTEPETFEQADAEIERLKRVKASRPAAVAVSYPREGPRVVNCNRESFDVLIDRRTKWGNPFREGRDGTREQCVAKYEAWAIAQRDLMRALHELRGKTLGCHCKPLLCHGDPLFSWANAPLDENGCIPYPKGEPHHLLGYVIGGERRLIVAQRIRGLIRIGDLPASGKGKRYLVADGLKKYDELDGLLADYQSQIARLKAIPAQVETIDDLIALAL